ncbi:hypothetical protein B0O80DRAFT_500338 [Mortierella sp. GBAus27b]|nr:hypothetical protein BGX31_000347 [Mortierella sp. GBA43]KAI8350995.1 hypothetical protein B0O80DRAFT_500338 [Mortierella sp. GBAus27b]
MSIRMTKHGRYASAHYPSTSKVGYHQYHYQHHPWDRRRGDAFLSCYRNKRMMMMEEGDKTVFTTGGGGNSSLESLPEYDEEEDSEDQEGGSTASTLEALFNENAFLAQQKALAQQEMTAARNDQARLEEKMYSLDQSLADARKEILRLQRAKRDVDREYEKDTIAFERERSQWADRESELSRSLKFATRPLIVQAPKKEKEQRRLSIVKESSDSHLLDKEPGEAEPADALPPQIQQQIAENNAAQTRALRAHEKMVTELRRQIISMNQDMIETKQMSRLRESELQDEINQAHEMNRNLMEENESFQLLLHEKSMNGEFMQTSIMKNTDYDDDPIGTPTSIRNGTSNLADELGKALSQLQYGPSSEELLAQVNALEEENKTLKEQGKALNVYISKILTRIMELPQMTPILASDYSRPETTTVAATTPAPLAPAVVVSQSAKSKGSSNGDNAGSDAETKKDAKKLETKQTGRPRSHSVLPFFWNRSTTPPNSGSGKSSNRNSSEEDSTGANNSFQEGHALGDDSPRGSTSSTDNATVTVVDHSKSDVLGYELLTTFDQPYSREQLKRRASIGVDRQRRQTIGSASLVNGNGHGRYGSDSGGAPSSQGRRSMVPSRNHLPPMPESHKGSGEGGIATIPEDQGQDTDMSASSPVLSISTSESCTAAAGSLSASSATPTTPGGGLADNGVLKVFRRLSMFGSNNSSSTALPLPSQGALKEDDTQ